MKGSFRSPAAQQAWRAIVQMDRMTEGAGSKVSPRNDEIGRNTEYLENISNRHFRYLMKHLGESSGE